MPFIAARHAEFAHAVVQIIAGDILGGDGAARPCSRCRSRRSDRRSRRTAPAVVGATALSATCGGLAGRLRLATPPARPPAPPAPSRANRPAAAPACAARTRRRAADRRSHSASYSSCQRASAARPACSWFQAARSGAGTSNGGAVQPRRCLAAATSSAPSGSPCASLVPALVGAPQPMTVLQQMSEGRVVSACAARIAAAIASSSMPVHALHVPAVGLKALRGCRRRTSPRPCRRSKCRCCHRSRSACRA